jgi:excinuclease UvrABC nuclease subunit
MYFIYKLYGKEGQPLYIGCTENFGRRLIQHKTQSPWYGKIVKIIAETKQNKKAALEAEAKAILAEQPKYNVNGLKFPFSHHQDRYINSLMAASQIRDEIRRLYEAGKSQSDIARQCGLSRQRIHQIIHKKGKV